MSEYAIRAQMVQYEQYRALFEGFRLHQWIYYSAVLMWKSQRSRIIIVLALPLHYFMFAYLSFTALGLAYEAHYTTTISL